MADGCSHTEHAGHQSKYQEPHHVFSDTHFLNSLSSLSRASIDVHSPRILWQSPQIPGERSIRTSSSQEAKVDTPTTRERLYVLVYQCEKCDRPIVRTYWSKVFSKSEVEDTAFTVSCEENCKSPETVPGRKARYIAELSWGREKQKTLQLPIWRVSTTLRQVLTEFSELFMCVGPAC